MLLFHSSDKCCIFSDIRLTFVKGGILSEDIEGFLPLPKNIPISYLKFSDLKPPLLMTFGGKVTLMKLQRDSKIDLLSKI